MIFENPALEIDTLFVKHSDTAGIGDAFSTTHFKDMDPSPGEEFSGFTITLDKKCRQFINKWL